MGRSLSAFLAKMARPPSSTTSAPCAWTLGRPERVAATGRSRSTCLRRFTACRAKAFPLESPSASATASAAVEALTGAEAPSGPIEAPHHLDSYRGPSGAGKFPAGLGTEILRQPCQYFSRSLASTAIAAVIRMRPTVAPPHAQPVVQPTEQEAVDELDVNPVDEQRGLAKEPHQREPVAREDAGHQIGQQRQRADLTQPVEERPRPHLLHQVRRVANDVRVVRADHPHGAHQEKSHHAGDDESDRLFSRVAARAHPVVTDQDAHQRPGQRRKQREPGHGSLAAEVRGQRPREVRRKVHGTDDRPQRDDRRRRQHREEDRRPPPPGRGDEGPHHHRRADAVEDVDAIKIVPVPEAAEDVLLQPKQVAERDHLQAALDRRPHHRRPIDLGSQLVLEADRHRHAHQQQEEPRRDSADEAGPAVGDRRLRRLVAPGVVEVSLDHQEDGQAAQPVHGIEAAPLGSGRGNRGRQGGWLSWSRLRQAVAGGRGGPGRDGQVG